MNRTAVFLLSVTLLAGCGKPTDAVIPTDMSTWDTELAPSLKKLSDEDRKLVSQYLLRAKLGEVFGTKGIPPGTTVGQALAAQKAWESEQLAKQAAEAALKKKLEQERAVATEELNKAVTVTLLSKKEREANFSSGRYEDTEEFRVGIQNNADKPIAGVSGEIKFIDVFDKEIGSVNFRVSETIAPGNAVTWTGSRHYNQFIAEHRAVWNAEEGKYKTKFIPDTVVFQDGTKLAIPGDGDSTSHE